MMNKRVGILTFHFADNNYGALLQTYATYVQLKRMGLKPMVINFLPNNLDDPLKSRAASIDNLMNGKAEFERFQKRFLSRTEVVNSFDDCKRLNRLFDFFLVGGDQVWRPSIARENLNRYFLDFTYPDKKRIAYAASFGSDVWEGGQRDKGEFIKLLADFDAISVREDSGVDICRRDFLVDAVHVLDPTLLLSEKDYSVVELDEGAVVEDKEHKKVVYHFSNDIEGKGVLSAHVRSVVHHQYEENWRVYNLYGKHVNFFTRKIFKLTKPGAWLSAIKSSDLVITDSYHCMLFSLIYKRDFICFINRSKGAARIESMLRYLDLEDRIAHTDNININLPQIDYNLVDAKLEKMREKSLNFLEQNLLLEERVSISF